MPRINKCPTCDDKKDYRAKTCHKCHFEYNHPRLGTGAERYFGANGYVVLRQNAKGIYEHRYVMEQHLSRKLYRHEHIHHRNGDRHDNRLENLELLSASIHHRVHMTGERAKAMSRLGHAARWGKNYVSSV